MPRHPADGPRLKTVYVSRSTRTRRRKGSSRRRRLNSVLISIVVLAVAGAGIAMRDQIARRIDHLVTRPHPAALVRDVTAPRQQQQQPVPAVIAAPPAQARLVPASLAPATAAPVPLAQAHAGSH